MSLDYNLHTWGDCYALCIACDRIVVCGVLSWRRSREGFLQVVKFALLPIFLTTLLCMLSWDIQSCVQDFFEQLLDLSIHGMLNIMILFPLFGDGAGEVQVAWSTCVDCNPSGLKLMIIWKQKLPTFSTRNIYWWHRPLRPTLSQERLKKMVWYTCIPPHNDLAVKMVGLRRFNCTSFSFPSVAKLSKI